VANKTTLQSPVKYQRRKKKRRLTMSIRLTTLLLYSSRVTSPSNSFDWCLDTGATCHVCSDKDLFSTYVTAKENVSMADRSTVAVLGTGTVVLILTSGKTLTLKSVKHVLSISKNLVFRSLLCDAKMTLDFQDGKIILSYKKIYFGNAYCIDSMYTISAIAPTSVINEISTSEYSSTL